MALVMALVPEFNSQIPIWFPPLRRRRQPRGYRGPLRLDVSRNLSSALAHSGLVTPLRACGPAGGSVAKGMKKISYRGYTPCERTDRIFKMPVPDKRQNGTFSVASSPARIRLRIQGAEI
jgi:hypothetical protein